MARTDPLIATAEALAEPGTSALDSTAQALEAA
jgi:hypothetical protein